MKKSIIFLIAFLFISALSYSSIIEDAAKSYKDGDYQKALELYKSINNDTNPYIIYNIANCYYKIGEKPASLLWYIKAFKIMPRNSKIKENMIRVAGENGEILFSSDIPPFLYSMYYFFSDLEIITLFELFFLLFAILIIVNTRRKDEKMLSCILITAVLFSVFGVWHILRKNSIFYSPAVVIKEADIYSGPKNSFNILATVPAARVVTVISKDENFTEIGIPRERIKGWIENDKILKAKRE